MQLSVGLRWGGRWGGRRDLVRRLEAAKGDVRARVSVYEQLAGVKVAQHGDGNGGGAPKGDGKKG